MISLVLLYLQGLIHFPDLEAVIEMENLAPADDRESALLDVLPGGAYTAIVRGKNDATGVALVEFYNIR